jgi:hypothetical protein
MLAAPMAGYSGKPLTQKLGIRPGFCIFVDGAPAAYGDMVGKLPAGATVTARLQAPLDMVHVFATEAAGLAAKLRGYCRHRAGRHDLGVVAEKVFGRRDRPHRCCRA